MDHAVDALREHGEGFLLNLTTSNGYAIEAMGRAIGGQAIVRIRELSGVRRELAEANFRLKALAEETEMLRGFADASPFPIWAKGAKGKVAAVAGAGAAVAGIAGGIAVAARDSRRRVLGVPLGKRSRIEETASTVVGKVGEPVKKVGSRFSRN